MPSILFSRKLATGLLLAALFYVATLLLLPIQPTSAYIVLSERVTNQTVWDSLFQNNQSLHGFPSQTRHHIRQGIYQWDNVHTGADFDVHEAYTDQDSYVQSFGFLGGGLPNYPGATTHNFNGSGKITFSAQSLNRDWTWNDNSCNVDWSDEEADVRIITTHESGHLIRLAHDPLHQEAVMWPNNTCKLETVDDDHLGVKDLYGTR